MHISAPTQICLSYSREEWDILSDIAGHDKKIRNWLYYRLLEFCKGDMPPEERIVSDRETKTFNIPSELRPYLLHLSKRFNIPPGTVAKRFVTDPFILSKLDDIKLLVK